MALIGDNVEAADRLLKTGSADLSYSLPMRTRFRVNIFKQRGTFAIVMRVIPTQVPTLSLLHLPPQLGDITELKNGLVLVTGPTGAGKSSTLAAIINKFNHEKPYHIITIEDPVEFLHTHRASTINQRELGSDTPTFAMALRAALRQAPKVILVGEMRDLETTEIALEAAETGHLVFSTLHTIDASKTIDRIIGLYPKSEEGVIRTRLAQTFRYIISQRLITRLDGRGRVAAVEVLKSTPRTREYIERGEGDGRSLIEAMNDGDLEGMQSFDTVIERMINEKLISKEDGLAYATNPHNLALRLSGFGGGNIGAEKRPPELRNSKAFIQY
jgi:twitching motility protein PilT